MADVLRCGRKRNVQTNRVQLNTILCIRIVLQIDYTYISVVMVRAINNGRCVTNTYCYLKIVKEKIKEKNTIWLESTIKGMFFYGGKNKMKNTNSNNKKN